MSVIDLQTIHFDFVTIIQFELSFGYFAVTPHSCGTGATPNRPLDATHCTCPRIPTWTAPCIFLTLPSQLQLRMTKPPTIGVFELKETFWTQMHNSRIISLSDIGKIFRNHIPFATFKTSRGRGFRSVKPLDIMSRRFQIRIGVRPMDFPMAGRTNHNGKLWVI